MAAEADAYFPITVDIFVDNNIVPFHLGQQFPPGQGVQLFFTTPYSHWFHPQTGKPTFPLAWCALCARERVVFQMMQLEQPVAPGIIYFARTEYCVDCVPRTSVHLVVDAEDQTFRFRRFFYADGSPILVKDPRSGVIQSTDEMDFRGVMHKEDFLPGNRARLQTTTQPYKLRSTSKRGVPYAGSR